MSLLTASFLKNSHILAGVYFIFLRKRRGANLKVFPCQILTLVKRLEKSKKLFPETITDKAFEKNSSFYVK